MMTYKGPLTNQNTVVTHPFSSEMLKNYLTSLSVLQILAFAYWDEETGSSDTKAAHSAVGSLKQVKT